MPWNKHRIVPHRPEALCDAVNQVLVVAAWKVCATNASSKQDIANKSAFDFGRIKHHMAWGVAWAVAYLQSVLA